MFFRKRTIIWFFSAESNCIRFYVGVEGKCLSGKEISMWLFVGMHLKTNSPWADLYTARTKAKLRRPGWISSFYNVCLSAIGLLRHLDKNEGYVSHIHKQKRNNL